MPPFVSWLQLPRTGMLRTFCNGFPAPNCGRPSSLCSGRARASVQPPGSDASWQPLQRPRPGGVGCPVPDPLAGAPPAVSLGRGKVPAAPRPAELHAFPSSLPPNRLPREGPQASAEGPAAWPRGAVCCAQIAAPRSGSLPSPKVNASSTPYLQLLRVQVLPSVVSTVEIQDRKLAMTLAGVGWKEGSLSPSR